MKKVLLCASMLGAVGLAASPQAANAASGVRIGTLECHESSGWGMVLAGSRAVRCAFSHGDHVERYTGAISKYGVDLGYQGSATLVWAVFAPSDPLGPGAIAGNYGGATAGAAVGVGLSANALIGGSDRSVALQPLSIEGATGLDVAAGVGTLSLRYQPVRAARLQPAGYVAEGRRVHRIAYVHHHRACPCATRFSGARYSYARHPTSAG